MATENTGKVPVHVSIIMDGNGRWAKQKGLERTSGHTEGKESVRAVTEECVAQGVKYLSLYAFSEENWGRPAEEVGHLMKLLMQSLMNEMDTMMDNDVRLLVLGNRSHLSPVINAAIDGAVAKTSKNERMTMIVMLSYSGKWDILQAAKRFAKDHQGDVAAIENATQADFEKYLVTAGIPDPDLIIRTSGEQRISNYFLWQGAYSELYFTPVLWPDFRKEELREALRVYSSRDRRYGKVK